MSEWRLLQLDFYNILAPAVTKVPEKDPDAEPRPRIEPGDDEYLDLKIRALMHGFDEAVDPNDVSHLLEEEPIPLRSMRIPIRRNVSAGWAPNGYGKTYIFDYLHRQSKYMQDGKVEIPPELLEAKQMNDDPLVCEARKLVEENYQGPYLFYEKEPFFSSEHWEVLFGDGPYIEDLSVISIDRLLSNPPSGTLAIAASFEDLRLKLAEKYGDGTLSGLTHDGEPMLHSAIQGLSKFQDSSFWQREVIRLNLENPGSEVVPYHCRGCVIENTKTNKILHLLEFPRLPDWDHEEDCETSRVYFREFTTDLAHGDGTSSGWVYSNSSEWSVFGYDWGENEYGYEVPVSKCELGGHAAAVRWMDCINVEYVEIPSLASKDRFSEFLKNQSNQFTTRYTFQSSRYQKLASNMKPLAPVTERAGLVRQIGLLGVIQEIVDEIDLICDPNFIGIDEFGSEIRVSTIHALIKDLEVTRNEWANLGEALCDDDMEVWGREVKKILYYLWRIRFVLVEHHEIRQTTFARLSNLFSEMATQPYPGLECLKAYGPVFDWMEARINYLDQAEDEPPSNPDALDLLVSAEQILVEQSDPFVNTLGEKLRLNREVDEPNENEQNPFDAEVMNPEAPWYRILKMHRSSRFPLNLIKSDELHSSSSTEEMIEITLRSLGIIFSFDDGVTVYPAENHYILAKNLNKCLSPSDHAHNPWGVEASIEFQTGEESGELTSASIQFHPVLTDRMNTLRPELLSFGMRSETVLQLKLSEILSSRRDQSYRGPDLLIIDEPEIGRSEYWTTMLIHRLRRFEQQFGSDGEQSVLIVSHRGDVLENCTQSGDYTIMHRTPQSEE